MCVKFSGRWSLGGLLLLLCVSGVTQAAVALQRWQTAQGATVMFVESHANPMVDVQVDFDAGTRRDTLAKPGVSELTADLLDAGTRRHDEEQLRGQLADLGAQFSTYAQDESAGLRLRSLTEPALLQPALALAAEMLSTPTFPTAVLQREKQRSIEMLKQQETKAEFLAERTLSRLVYPTHPYGNDARLSETSLQSISRADLVTFWRQHYQPQRAVVSIVGDVSREQAQRLAEQLLAGLPANGRAPQAIPAVPLAQTEKELHLRHAGSQTHIAVGMAVLKRDDPDYFPLVVGNYILGGGGFDSRLMKEVRDQRGLTYGVSSEFEPLQQAGPFTISLSTRNEQAAQALQVVRQTLQHYVQDGPTAAELEQAKANIIGSFPLRFDSNRKLLSYLALIGQYQLPLTYLDDYVRQVKSVTVQQVHEAWQRRVNPAALHTVVVGATQ